MPEKIILFSKSELAKRYRVSVKTLFQNWIHKNKDYLHKLEKAGYEKGKRLITPNQLKIIYAIFGKPEEEEQ